MADNQTFALDSTVSGNGIDRAESVSSARPVVQNAISPIARAVGQFTRFDLGWEMISFVSID